jgi:hypothetical protein
MGGQPMMDWKGFVRRKRSDGDIIPANIWKD